MQKLISLIVATCVSTAAFGAGKCVTNDKWTGTDKQLHVFAGTITGAAGMAIFDDPLKATILTAAVAGAKEAQDKNAPGHKCSFQDFAVTVAAGAAIAYGIKFYAVPTSTNSVSVGFVSEF